MSAAEDAPKRLAGSVVLVGTPIGNLGDLSPRGSEALRDADVILCEDTRRTRALLSALGIAAPRLISYHAHNEAAGAAHGVHLAEQGSQVVVISDAGMPGISDPGARIVRAAVDAGVTVSVVPGPTAAVSALVVSGLAGERWCFEGFLPRRGGERGARLAAVAAEERASVIYESPHRVPRTLEDLRQVCGGDREVALGRELTKLHEELWRGTLDEAVGRLGHSEARGEWVLVVAGATPSVVDDDEIVRRLAALAADGVERRDAVIEVAGSLDVARRRVYDLELRHRAPPG